MKLRRVDWEVTSKCKMPCIACKYKEGSYGTDLTFEEIKNVCDQISEMGCSLVRITGGDIFLLEDWYGILSYMKELGISLEIETSGLTITDKVINQLKDFDIKRLIYRIDTISERITFCERGIPKFSDKISNIINKTESCGITSGVITTISLLTFHELPHIYNLILNTKAKFWEFAHIPSHGKVMKLITIGELEYYFIGLYVSKLRCKTEWNKLAIFGNHSFGYYSKLIPPHSTSGNWIGCKAGKTVVGIRCDGTVEGCIYLNRKYFDTKSLKEYSLKEILEDPNFCSWNDSYKKNNLSGFCKECFYAEKCQSGCAGSAFESCQKIGSNTRCYHYVESYYENITPRNDFELVMKNIVNGQFKANGDLILENGNSLTQEYIDSLVLSDKQEYLLSLIKND